MLPYRGLTELKYRATLPFLSLSSSLHFTYLEIVGSSPVAGVLVSEKFGIVKIAIRNSSLSSFKINCLFEISVTKIVLS